MRLLDLSLCLLLLPLAGCGAGGVCGKLGAAPSCGDSAASQCTDAIAKAKADEPACAAQVTALVECLGNLELSCTGTTSVAATGDGMIGGGQNFTDLGGYSVVVSDSLCDVHRRGLEACRTCPAASGAKEVSVLGVGDRCGSGGTCASGLSCQGGICTRSCTVDDDCKARADDCKLQFQYANVCASGKCTRSCGSDSACSAWVSSSSKCVSNACSL